MSTLPIPLLLIHTKQFVAGVSPGGVDNLISFLHRWSVSKWDIANMLDTAQPDTAALIRAYFDKHAELKEWLIPIAPNDVSLYAENVKLRALLSQIHAWIDIAGIDSKRGVL